MNVDVGIAATQDDFCDLRDLITEYEIGLAADLRHSDHAREIVELPLVYAAPNAAFLAAIGPISGGCVALSEHDDATGVIKRLYVRPQYRKLGVARRLLAELIAFARRRDYSRLVLDTDRDRLAAAYQLYVAFGFKECAPYALVDYASPTYMDLSLK